MTLLHKRPVFVVMVTVVCFAMVFGIGELGVRLFVENSDVTPAVLRSRSVQFDPAIFARHVFKQEAQTVEHFFGKRKGVVWEINEKGYRGHNFETKKPDGVIRIMVYGGSAAFDTMVSEGKDWPSQVEAKLRESGFPQVEVVNAGIMGHTSLESVARLFTEGFVFQPDYVVIYNGWNDIKYLNSHQTALRTLQPPLQKFDPRIQYRNSLDEWLCETSQLYNVLRRIVYKKKLKLSMEGIQKFEEMQDQVSALNPDGFRQYRLAMEIFVDLAVNIRAKPILVTQARLVHSTNTPVQRERIEYHHVGLTHEALVETFDRLDAIVRNVAAEKGAMLIDASAKLSGKDWVFSDHVHFDLEGRGSEAMAQVIVDHLKEVLPSPTGMPPSF
ncbi:MAG: hypothetical protein H0X47_07465 [Nitrospirales bacterium]|nr:hypothetical protein [Nitrospirales bacterium]